MKKNIKKVFNAWAMYDWANSVYNLVITTTFFPVYYTLSTQASFGSDKVQFFGVSFINTALYDYALAFAYLITALAIPILSSIADIRHSKMIFLKLFTYLGGISCCLLYFFSGYNVEWGIIFLILSTMGYTGGLVFINAYLPLIAKTNKHDMLSARGFIFGYIGSIILQVIGFVLLLTKPYGITDSEAIRITFLLVGLWWIGFAHIPFYYLRKYKLVGEIKKENIWLSGFKKLNTVWKKIKQLPILKNYLFAFFFYNMGVQTVMLVAINFGSKELGMSSTSLISVAVAIQFVAILGAWIMAKLSKTHGNIKTLIFVVFLWLGTPLAGYFIQTEFQFYFLAALVGLVMGGIQSLSRSTFSKFIPAEHEATSFFSFYDVAEKMAIVIGLFSFGWFEEHFGNMRTSILLVMVEFAIGLIFLYSILSKTRKRLTP